MSEKVCSKCGQSKQLSAFKFEKSRGLYRSSCRACINLRQRDRYATDDDYRLEVKARVRARNQQIKESPELAQAAREQRRKYKRLGRLCAKPGFKPARHDAHVKCWKVWRKKQQARPVLHDAHVQLARSDQLRWWHLHVKHQPCVALGRQRRRRQARETLASSYLTLLMTNGRTSCPVSAGIPSALIELKRVHLRLVRYLNEQRGKANEDCNSTSA